LGGVHVTTLCFHDAPRMRAARHIRKQRAWCAGGAPRATECAYVARLHNGEPVSHANTLRSLTAIACRRTPLVLQIAGKKSKKPGLTAKQARLKGTDFEAFEKLKEAEAKAAAKRGGGGKAGKAGAAAATAGAAGGEADIKAPSRWRQEHEAFQAIATAGKVEGSAPASPVKAAPLPPAPADAAAADGAAADGSAAAPLDASMAAAAAAGPRKPKLGHIGDKVVVIDRGLVGVLQFRGPIWGLKKGTWIGVEFHDAPHGRNDGSFEVRAAALGRCAARCLPRLCCPLLAAAVSRAAAGVATRCAASTVTRLLKP